MNRDGTAFEQLEALGAGEFAHVNGSLIAHLSGTARLLEAWGSREALCSAGLYHAVYGTDGYGASLVDRTMRHRVAAIIGPEAEEITYLYGACERGAFWPRIATDLQCTFVDRFAGASFEIPHQHLRDFCELTFANELEIASDNLLFIAECGDFLRQLFDRMKPLVSAQAYRHYKRVLS
jgi:hypothetical protein